ncbi:MAG: glutamine amidotransferase, partial [Lachnospiraceae bacterium]|nr:glutamine amidotransferase [Lachnospiraceae bacterium]
VIATYLHGPLLPKNPEVCDWLLRRALKRRYGVDTALAELPDAQEIQANRNIVERYKRRKL